MGAAEYDALVMEDGPRYYWKLEGNGVDAANVNDIDNLSSITWPTPGLLPGSISSMATTSTSSASLSTADVSIPSGLLTIAFWCTHGVMGSATSWGYHGPGRFTNNGNQLIPGGLIPNGASKFTFNDAVTGHVQLQSPISTGDNLLHHVVHVIDTDHARLHIDGVEVLRKAITPGQAIPVATRFGPNLYPQGGLNSIPGKFERVSMHYGKALSGDRIRTYYEAALDQSPSAYREAVMADGPIVYYRMNESAGTDLIDASGNAHHGTYVNVPTLGVPGLLVDDPNLALQLDGAQTEYGQIPYATWMDSPNQSSFETWVKINPGNSGAPFSRAGDSVAPWYITVGANATFKLCWNTSGGAAGITGTKQIDDGQPHHIVGVVDYPNAYLYVDGELDGQLLGTIFKPRISTADLRIGTRGTTSYLTGVVDECALYNTALSPERIKAHYDAGIAAGVPQVLIRQWDGAALPRASLSGWWDDALGAIEPAKAVGWWDGSAIQPLALAPTSYKDVVLSMSPDFYLPMDDPVGSTIAQDLSPNNRDFTIAAGTQLEQPSLMGDGSGKSMVFTGASNSYLQRASETWMDGAAFTMVCRVKRAAGDNLLVGRWGAGVGGTTRRIWLFYGSAVLAQIMNSVGYDLGPDLVDGQTYTLAFRSTGTKIEAYVDGVLTGSLAVSASPSAQDSAFAIGRAELSTFSAAQAQGMGFWMRALDPVEIAALHDAAVGKKNSYRDAVMSTGPSFYLPFDEATGATIASDISGNGRNGAYTASVTAGNPPLAPGSVHSAHFGGKITMSSLPVDTSWSIEAIFKTTASGGYLIGDDRAYIRLFSTVTQVKNIQTTAFIGLNGLNLIDGLPHHVVWVQDATTMYFYSDGVLRGSVGSTAPVPPSTLTIGGLGVDVLNGDIDSFAFYSGKALSATEVAGNYAASGLGA